MLDAPYLQSALAAREAQSALRTLSPAAEGIDFVCNDYLGLAQHPAIAAAAMDAYAQHGSGSKGARLLGGNHPLFLETEQALARWKGVEAALIFNCGYSANVGVLSALCQNNTHLFCDRLDHASMLDGYQLSRAQLHRFAHNDPAALEQALRSVPAQAFKVIAVEAVYSMDGNQAPLQQYADLAEQYQAFLYVDEAHSEGLCGPEGKGLVHALGLEKRVDLTLATFGKAYGCAGACVFGTQLVVDYLVNHARSFIYSTALPPGAVAAMNQAVRVSVQESWRREHALELAEYFRQGLRRLHCNYLSSTTQIVPVVLESNERALAASRYLAQQGLRVAAIRPPTVPVGSARLRVNFTANHTRAQVDLLLAALTDWLRQETPDHAR